MALLAFLDEFVQLLADERRKVEVVVLNPLVLVLPDGDCLPFHRNARYARYTYNWFGRRGPVGLQQNRVRTGDDGVNETRNVSFAHQKSEISGDAVSSPYCASCPLARTAVSSENLRFSGSRESSILERLLEDGGLAPIFS